MYVLTTLCSDAEKSRFLYACDAMIHARADGETFGMAVAEFSVHNRPVLTVRLFK